MNTFKNLRTTFWLKSIISAAMLFSLFALSGHFAMVNGQSNKEELCENNKKFITHYLRQMTDLSYVMSAIIDDDSERKFRDTISSLKNDISNGRISVPIRDIVIRKELARSSILEWNSQWDTDPMAFQKAYRDKLEQTLNKARRYETVANVRVEMEAIDRQIEMHKNRLLYLKCDENAPDLSGTWTCIEKCPAGGINKTGSITQNGNSLTFTNEGGGSSIGLIKNSTTVEATDWSLTATIEKDGTELHWSNGTVWVKK